MIYVTYFENVAIYLSVIFRRQGMGFIQLITAKV